MTWLKQVNKSNKRHRLFSQKIKFLPFLYEDRFVKLIFFLSRKSWIFEDIPFKIRPAEAIANEVSRTWKYHVISDIYQ